MKLQILLSLTIFYSYFNYSTFLSNLNYNFLRRLRNNRTNVNFILDWYENQIIDKESQWVKTNFLKVRKLKVIWDL